MIFGTTSLKMKAPSILFFRCLTSSSSSPTTPLLVVAPAFLVVGMVAEAEALFEKVVPAVVQVDDDDVSSTFCKISCTSSSR